MEIIGTCHTHVVTFAGRHWPAEQRADGTLIDFRLFGEPVLSESSPCEVISMGKLGYDAVKLTAAGVPADLVVAAGESEPKGFVLLA